MDKLKDMKKELLYKINNIEYLLVERLVTSANNNQVQSACKKYDCIQQGIEEVGRGGWTSNPYTILAILVPISNIVEFNKEV